MKKISSQHVRKRVLRILLTYKSAFTHFTFLDDSNVPILIRENLNSSMYWVSEYSFIGNDSISR